MAKTATVSVLAMALFLPLGGVSSGSKSVTNMSTLINVLTDIFHMNQLAIVCRMTRLEERSLFLSKSNM